MVFSFYPTLDLKVSQLFYSSQSGFFLADNLWVQLSYRLFASLHFVVLIGLLVALAISTRFVSRWQSLTRKQLSFLLLVLLLGPGLLVNVVLKDHSTGRARPVQTIEFGGTRVFTPPLVEANQCKHNCSFVSGHASMGYFLMAFAWIRPSRRWLTAGIVLGSAVGLGRMVQGGHYLSDVVFCFWTVFFTIHLLAYQFGFRLAPSKSRQLPSDPLSGATV
ncbi:hypothetical protein WH50_14480 [Pokkaliibacter plantistimulans]|uniref:Phosphatidic acid phosphatase type 2/haloperoxidase domain-containing protein n=2 Tax=Pokkaliibacter plantistimulans TaxID=1635171 RepID=A0ABX5LWP6_9GAMM|nr:hypothetical protein WH50_14480 [Pokkaliibacter plantistimulans]